MSDVHFNIEVHPEDVILVVTQALGAKPYVHVSVDLDEDDNATFSIRAGGGVRADREEFIVFFQGVADFFSMIPEEQFEAALARSVDEDDEDDDGFSDEEEE